MDFLKDREFQLLAVKGFVLEIVWSVFPGIFVKNSAGCRYVNENERLSEIKTVGSYNLNNSKNEE